jgi:hypothetical protein
MNDKSKCCEAAVSFGEDGLYCKKCFCGLDFDDVVWA